MAQFRTIADIKTLVLQKSGEATNGNSAYETSSLIYINQVHQAIVGGGSILNVQVDEPWIWARAPRPISFKLLPAYTTGTVHVINDNPKFTMSDLPDVSSEASDLAYYEFNEGGWFLRVTGERTVYRIVGRDTSNNISLDMPYLGTTNTAATYTIFKLEYEIKDRYVTIDRYCNKIDFTEAPTYTAGNTIYTATLELGVYTPKALIEAIAAGMTSGSPGGNTYTGTWDVTLNQYKLVHNVHAAGSCLGILGGTGTNKAISVLNKIGIDQLDSVPAASVATQLGKILGGNISRLIEPFRVFNDNTGRPLLIESTDAIKMEEMYPICDIRAYTPELFCKIFTNNVGRQFVRFNSYPLVDTKVEVNWIPIPSDLQDNAASLPLIPRGDIDCLIHGASALILADKNDTKAADMLKLCSNQLEAMERKNRNERLRTGHNFAQIEPRADLAHRRTMPRRYGYTADS